MLAASATPAGAESSGFVTCCGELTGTISQVPPACPACLKTIGGRGRSRGRQAVGRETPYVG
jgi:hypothetical protein